MQEASPEGTKPSLQASGILPFSPTLTGPGDPQGPQAQPQRRVGTGTEGQPALLAAESTRQRQQDAAPAGRFHATPHVYSACHSLHSENVPVYMLPLIADITF